MAASSQPKNLLPKARLIIGGEASQWPWIRQVAAEAACQIYNHYGPTETTVGVLTYPVPPSSEIQSQAEQTVGNLPVGYPLPNTQAYILDALRQPVPVGCLGELYIGGALVTRGYLNRPDLTAEKFIPNPFGKGRLYNTGDWTRYLPNGAIEFFGRKDDQVKIHGFRIELGEIAAHLHQHPTVRECVVLAVEDAIGEKRLVAYVVQKLSDEKRTSDKTSKAFLQQKLPAHMVPAAFVIVDTLPLTAHGKVDRAALASVDSALEVQPQRYTHHDPRNLQERQLVQLWEEVLGVSAVGIQDNFFELGGHSLLAVRLIEKIKQAFRKNIAMNYLFQYPTVEKLSTILTRLPSTATAVIKDNANGNEISPQPYGNFLRASLVPMQPRGQKPPLFCVPGTSGNPIYLAALARHLGPTQPFYALQAAGLDGVTAPHKTIEEAAVAYLAEIRQVQPIGPYYLSGHSHGGRIAYEMAQQLLDKGERVALTALIDAGYPGMRSPDILEHDDAALMLGLVGYITQNRHPNGEKRVTSIPNPANAT